jgi:hypothetical protein
MAAGTPAVPRPTAGDIGHRPKGRGQGTPSSATPASTRPSRHDLRLLRGRLGPLALRLGLGQRRPRPDQPGLSNGDPLRLAAGQ